MILNLKMPLLHISLLFFIAISITSCGEKYLYEADKSIPGAQWLYKDTVDFKLPMTDTTQLYNLYIRFAYLDTFPNQNIYLKLYTRFPNGKRVSRIRSFDLFDVEGKPQGKCSGATCETQILLQDKLYFNQLGDHLITLEQYDRSNPLKGLTALGIRLEKTKQKK